MYQEQRDDQNILIGIKRLADEAGIPLDSRNRDYRKYLAWLAKGNTPAPDPDVLANVKVAKRQEFIGEAVTRIAAQVSWLDTYDRILDFANYYTEGLIDKTKVDASPTLKKAKDIYVFVKGTSIPDINSKTTVADVLVMNASTYSGWPA